MQQQPQEANYQSGNFDVFPPHLQALLKQYPKDPVALLKDRSYEQLSQMLSAFKCFQKIEDHFLAKRVRLILISLETRIKIYKQMNDPLLASEQAQKLFLQNSSINVKSEKSAGPGGEFTFKNLAWRTQVYSTDEIRKFGEIQVQGRKEQKQKQHYTYERLTDQVRIVDNCGRICLPEEEIQSRLSQSRKFHLILRRWAGKA